MGINKFSQPESNQEFQPKFSSQPQPQLSPTELEQWQLALAEANRHNIWCHCRQCDREWVASTEVPCECGSHRVEYIACWQFPDD